MNIFNQVALEDLIVVGEILTGREIAAVEMGEEESSEEEVEVEVSGREIVREQKEDVVDRDNR
jgi:tartrate dehydratase beta subunit/fumarate hydratase class I family protein